MSMPSEWDRGGYDAADADGGGLIQAIGRRKGLVFMVLVIALGLGYLYYLKADRLYQSSAQLLVVKQETGDMPITGIDGQTNYENEISTHMLLAKSQVIVQAAVERRDLASLPEFAGVSNPATLIASRISTERGGGRAAPDPNVFDIRYAGPSPEHCEVVLEAVVEAYQEFLGNTYQSAGEQTVALIREAKGSLGKQLSEEQRAYKEFRKTSPLMTQTEDGQNLHEVRMLEIEKDRSKVMLDVSNTEAQLSAVRDIKRTGGNPEALTLLIGESKILRPSKEGKSQTLQYQLFEAMVEEQVLLTRHGEDHPKVEDARIRIRILREQLGGDGSGKQPNFLDLYLESLQQELTVAQRRLDRLNTLFTTERTAAKALEDAELEDATLRGNIKRIQELYDNVNKRLDELGLAANDSGIDTKIIRPAELGVRIQPVLPVVMAIASVFGMLAGILLAYVVDSADSRFRDPEDVRRELGLPILGHVPPISTRRGSGKAARHFSNALCTVHRPGGREAESFRNIRTSLVFNKNKADAINRVIQITSPSPGDGKSTLAANLAVCMSQSNKRTLIIDADMRNPSVHKILGVKNSVGLSTVLNDQAELPDAVQSVGIENLSILPAGPIPAKPAELLLSPQFEELLDVVKEKYDFVIIDTPPVLPVSDPATVAPMVDAVIMVLRLNQHARQNATTAMDTLADVGGHVLGLVINGTETDAGYYGRNQPGGGYGESSGYDQYYSEAPAPPFADPVSGT